MPEVADLHRIAADQVTFHFFDVRRDRRVTVELRVRLAPADDSVVGGYLDEHPVLGLRGMHNEGFDVLDFHFAAPLVCEVMMARPLSRAVSCWEHVTADPPGVEHGRG